MKDRPYVSGVIITLVLGVTLGCSRSQQSSAAGSEAATGDPQITSAIQGRLYADPAIPSKQISVQTVNGVVTLAGTVATEDERSQASAAAATIPGVKTVVNNVTVAPIQAAAAPPEPKPQPARMIKAHTNRPVARRSEHRSDDWDRNDPAPEAQIAQAAPVPVAPAAPASAVPPPPPPAKVTVESGTTLAIRLVDSIDSETAQPGQTFRATLGSPIAVDGSVVIPEGYDVQGHIVEVQSAGKFQGRSVLALQLDRIQVGDKHYSISTNQYRREGSSRTKNTVAKVGAGSVIGAIIGGIAGGGKGAGIGAAAGGGIGGGVQAAGKGQQIKLPSETVLTFSLQAPVTVTPTTQPRNGVRPKLDSAPQGNPDNSSNPSNLPQR
jgi:hypothetical protein